MSFQSGLLWYDPDWLKQAKDWIHAEVQRQYIHITGELEQPHIYPCSIVWRVPTNEGTLFSKTTALETVYESGLYAGIRCGGYSAWLDAQGDYPSQSSALRKICRNCA